MSNENLSHEKRSNKELKILGVREKSIPAEGMMSAPDAYFIDPEKGLFGFLHSNEVNQIKGNEQANQYKKDLSDFFDADKSETQRATKLLAQHEDLVAGAINFVKIAESGLKGDESVAHVWKNDKGERQLTIAYLKQKNSGLGVYVLRQSDLGEMTIENLTNNSDSGTYTIGLDDSRAGRIISVTMGSSIDLSNHEMVYALANDPDGLVKTAKNKRVEGEKAISAVTIELNKQLTPKLEFGSQFWIPRSDGSKELWGVVKVDLNGKMCTLRNPDNFPDFINIPFDQLKELNPQLIIPSNIETQAPVTEKTTLIDRASEFVAGTKVWIPRSGGRKPSIATITGDRFTHSGMPIKANEVMVEWSESEKKASKNVAIEELSRLNTVAEIKKLNKTEGDGLFNRLINRFKKRD